MKSKKMWLRWIAITLLVILCINNVGSIALASEIREGGSVLEEKSILEEEFQGEGVTSEEVFRKMSFRKKEPFRKNNFKKKKLLRKKNSKKKKTLRKKVIFQKRSPRKKFQKKKAFSRIKHPLSNRKREKNLRIPRKPQKDMILILCHHRREEGKTPA